MGWKKGSETVLVFDLGGGTFDVSILDIGDGVVEVRATSGDTHLGGDDFDRRIVDYLAEEFQRDNGIDLRLDPQALQRLFEAAEKAKVELSAVTQTTINLPFITADANGPKHLGLEEDACAFIARQGFDPVYGARPLRRYIAREVETPVARALVAGDVRDGAVIKVGLTDGKLDISYDNSP